MSDSKHPTLDRLADPSAIHVDVPTSQTVWARLDSRLGNRDICRGERANVYYRREKPGSNFGPIIVRYHETDIVIAYVDGRVTFESGGWRTYTTKERMNDFTPSFAIEGVKVGVNLSSNKGVWSFSRYVYSTVSPVLKPEDIPSDFEVKPDPKDPYTFAQCGTCLLTWDDSISTGITPVPSGRCPFEYFHRTIFDNLYEDGPLFFDGITLDSTGMPVGKVLPNNGTDPDADIKKAIDAYVEGYTDEVIRDLIVKARDGGHRGDCLFCQLDSNPENEKTDPGHFEDHFEESYYMASVIICALQARNYGSIAHVLSITVDMGQSGDRIRKDIRTYLRQRLATNTTGARPNGSLQKGWYGNA